MRRHGKPPTRSAITLTRECVLTGLAGKGSADVGPHTLGALGRPHGSLTCIRGPAPMSASGALFGPHAMSDLSPECTPRRTSADHSEFMGLRPRQSAGGRLLKTTPPRPSARG